MCRSDAVIHTVFCWNFRVNCVIDFEAHQLCCCHLVYRSATDPPFIPWTGLLLFSSKTLGEILTTHQALQWHHHSPKGNFPMPKPWKANAKKIWSEENNRAVFCHRFFLISLTESRAGKARERTLYRKWSLKQGE